MALKFKGTILKADFDALTSDDVTQYDAYRVNDSGSYTYEYCSVKGSGTPTWTEYDPIQIIKDVIYTKVWACVGAPSDTSNEVQFPELTIGCFAVDVSSGDFYAYQGTDGWSNAWTGTAIISL